MGRLRNTCFTLNNYSELSVKQLIDVAKHVKYIVWGKEIGEEGTPHLQGYIELKQPKTISALNKMIGWSSKPHYEPRGGTAKQAAGYCKKGSGPEPEEGWGYYFDHPHETWDNDEYEFGEISKQGAREDLNELKDLITSGKRTVDEICVEDPIKVHQYGRVLDRLEDIALRKRFRKEMTQGIWYWGESGAGKSHKAMEGYDSSTHYVKCLDDDWWDGYTGQETVIFNEFRGQVSFSRLLDLTDKWPTKVKRRNREPVPFLAKRLIVTSVQCPRDVYRNLVTNEPWEQFDRRFVVEQLMKK